MRLRQSVRYGGLSLAALLGLAACAPAVRPPAFQPREQVPLAGLPTGVAGWPDPAWWKRYGDPQLDRLVELAMRRSPNLEEAEARYRSALRAVDVQKAELNPQVRGLLAGSHGYNDTRLHGEAPGQGGSVQGFELDPGHSWSNDAVAGALATRDLDLWGRQKAAVAAAVGQARAAEAERAAAATSLQYNLANTYFNWQVLQARLAVAREAARDTATLRALTAARVQAGLDDPQSLDSADAQLAERRRSVAQLEGQGSLDLAQLAALAGVAPAELGTLAPRPLPAADTELPPDARLALLGRRPDIAAARWQIEASLRDIDQARAAYYPDVSLSALGGYLQAHPDLGSGTRTGLALGNAGVSISLPIFSGGRLKAQFESSQAQLDSAVASYDASVVQAAQDLARQVLTLRQLGAEQAQQQRELEATGKQNHRIEDRRRHGLVDDRSYLDGRLQLDQQRDAQIQLHGQLLATHLSLIHALGGGYQSGPLPGLPAAAAKEAER